MKVASRTGHGDLKKRGMSMRNCLVLTTFLAACKGGSDPTDGATTEPPPVPPPVVDTGWPAGDLGNMHIAHHVNDDRTEVYAVFTTSNPGFTNFAQCSIRGSVCLGGIPVDEDDWVDVDPDQDIERETLQTRFLGFEIEYGPYTLAYREDADTKFGFYAADVSTEELPEGWIGVKWEGQWNPYNSKEDLYVSRPIELLEPTIDQNVVFTNGELVPFEWVPTGEGIVTLMVNTRFTLARMYHLEDDGYFELDVDSLGFPNDIEDVTFTFTRWNEVQLRKFGHVVDLLATSDATFTGEYYNIGSRERIRPADDCPEAQGQIGLEGGYYYGFLAPHTNDMEPICGSAFLPGGKDAFVRLEVQPLESVAIDFNTYEESGVVYFVSECDDEATCFAGSDTSPDPNVNEYLNYFNPTDDVRVLYIGLDSDPANGSVGDTVFTLDMDKQVLTEPPMSDTCADAEAAAPLAPANYYAQFFAYADDVNPGSGGCTGTSVPGADAMAPIVLQAGQSLSVNVNMPGADPALYLLFNCEDEFACPVGRDVSISANEQLAYTNAGNYPQTVYLVVDSQSGMAPYFMSINVQ